MTMTSYRIISVIMGMTFGIVGLLFLLMSNHVLIFFNALSSSVGMESAASGGDEFYVVLAIAYMYIVSLISFLMFRHPGNTFFPLLLFNGKIASSLLSLLMFLADKHLLIYFVNFVIDGSIALTAMLMYRSARRGFQ